MTTWILYAFGALGLWGVIAPTATYYATQWKTQIEERASCDIRVKTAVDAVAREVNEAADRAIAAAADAARAVAPTPTAPAELAALCRVDKHCRGRKP